MCVLTLNWVNTAVEKQQRSFKYILVVNRTLNDAESALLELFYFPSRKFCLHNLVFYSVLLAVNDLALFFFIVVFRQNCASITYCARFFLHRCELWVFPWKQFSLWKNSPSLLPNLSNERNCRCAFFFPSHTSQNHRKFCDLSITKKNHQFLLDNRYQLRTGHEIKRQISESSRVENETKHLNNCLIRQRTENKLIGKQEVTQKL